MPATFEFSAEDIRALARAFGCKARRESGIVRFRIGDGERRLVLELYSGIRIGRKKGTLVSVYTRDAHLQLHFCSGFVVSRMLGEVTFVGEQGGKLAGLIVEKQGGCSFYANVDRSLLSGDFTRLGPEVMMSGIALSMTDTILSDRQRRTRKGKKKPR
jgi:hypothetical protein